MTAQNSQNWDILLDSIEESAAAGMMRSLLDPIISSAEKQLDLSDAARIALFGDLKTKYRSLLLSYADLLKKRAREEKEKEISLNDDEDGKSGDINFGGDAPLLHFPDITAETARAKRLFGELSERNIKILPGDRVSPRERILSHINFEKTDRVAYAPQLGFHTARAGGITVREFMTDGRKAAAAAIRAWELYGGFDMLPFNFPTAYLFPVVPETHSRFYSHWSLPECDELPRMNESPLDATYETFIREGFSSIVRTEAGRLPRELRRMALQMVSYLADTAVNFPRASQFYPYALGIINHPADLLSMWLGFEKFMMDCITAPDTVREACERLAPGLVELGEVLARIAGERQVLFGASRISGSWISRKMFDALFANTFRGQLEQATRDGFKWVCHLDNDFTPMLDFFLQLPRHGGFMHLDQTDLFKAKSVLHGHLCLMGNLHPGLVAAGTPREVTNQCERLIKEVGAGGGFILSSACEVPVDAPVENIKAAKQAVDKWGWY